MKTKKESQLSKNNNGELVLNGTRVRYVPQVGILGIVVSRQEIFNCREKARFSSENYSNHEIWFRHEYEVIVIRRKYRKSEKFVVRKPVIKLVAYYINPDEVIPSGAVVWVEPSPQLDCFMIINWGTEVEFCPPASSGSSSDQGGEGSEGGVRIDVPIRICVENLASSGQPGGGGGGGGNIRTKTEYLPVYLPRGSILDWDNRYCVINEQDCCEFDYGRNSSDCCPPGDVAYVIEYDITVNGQTYIGSTGEAYWSGAQYDNTAAHSNSLCNPPYIFMNFTLGCLEGVSVGGLLGIQCGYDAICSLSTPDDMAVTVSGCPGNPTLYFEILPGRCASGSFVVRPAGSSGGNNGGGGGSNPGDGGGSDPGDGGGSDPGDGGGGGGNQHCCPPDGSNYLAEYDFAVNGETLSGYTNVYAWSNNFFSGLSIIPSSTLCQGNELYIYITVHCAPGNIAASLNIYCNDYVICHLNFNSLDTSGSDFDLTVTNCPNLPTFNFTIKPGRCISGGFVVRPAQ